MEAINIQFSVLQERYRNTMPEKRVVLEHAWELMCSDLKNPAGLKELFPLVHRLAGSASSYGFEHLGDAALRVHDILDRHRVRGGQLEPADVAALVHELKPQMEQLIQALALETDR
ncbi:MAG: hypothetical protein EYC71_13365 [Gammaproteobacteria bacterium]|nr:MAG: hypothetical protein EYC71_13365 [Gammaproteobacteria bacterium]